MEIVLNKVEPSADLAADLPVVNMDTERYKSVGFLRMAQRAVREHGPRLRLIFEHDERKIMLIGPEFSEAWRRNSRSLVKDVDEYPAPASLARMILDNNLTTAREGDEWEDMRVQVSPLMRYKMTSYADAVEAASDYMIDALLADRPEETLWDICAKWSAMTVCHPVLGVCFDDAMVLDMVNGLRHTMFHLVKESANVDHPTLLNDKVLTEMRQTLVQITRDAIYLSKPDDPTMVATLLRDRDHTFGTQANDALVKELQPILMGALAAAVHNNSLAMFWLMTNLAQSQSSTARIAQEAATTAGDDWHMQNAPVAMAAVRESLRLHPVLPFIERKASQDLDLCGVPVKKGETIIMSAWFVHRDPDTWADPLRFDINRFLNIERVDMTKWFPFGLGHRACIGSNLALNQLGRSITKICHGLEFTPPKNVTLSNWQPTYRVLLEPRDNGAQLDSKRRNFPTLKEL
ncbi:MAG: cytochrome P450 [Sulfitobacter sp.]